MEISFLTTKVFHDKLKQFSFFVLLFSAEYEDTIFSFTLGYYGNYTVVQSGSILKTNSEKSSIMKYCYLFQLVSTTNSIYIKAAPASAVVTRNSKTVKNRIISMAGATVTQAITFVFLSVRPKSFPLPPIKFIKQA